MNSLANVLPEPVPTPVAPPPTSSVEQDPRLPETIIQRQPGWRFINFEELWRFRELLFFLTWRDVKIRYKQTVLGATWAVIQPLATMLVFTLFLGKFLDVPHDGCPYPLFIFAGLLPWTFLANATSTAGQSVVANQKLVTKVHFPRLIIPMGSVGAGLVDFAVAFGLLLLMMAGYSLSGNSVSPGWQFLLVPVLLAGLVILAMGIGVLLSALTVAYRDFRHVIPFFVQFWMFATPSIYMQANAAVNPEWQLLLPLNPAQGLIANLRAALLGGPLDLYSLCVSTAVSVLLFIAGCLYFRRVERTFADIL